MVPAQQSTKSQVNEALLAKVAVPLAWMLLGAGVVVYLKRKKA